MAEEEESFSNKNSPYNSDGEETQRNACIKTTRPDLGIENIKYSVREREDTDSNRPSTSKAANNSRKEDSPFSFRHFLKRDLSLPSNSSTSSSNPKVYASTVQHSPNRSHELKNNFNNQNYNSSNVQGNPSTNFPRTNLNDNIPSLPDFVQDHILIEQAYFNGSMNIDNLPYNLSQERANFYGYDYPEEQAPNGPIPLDLPRNGRQECLSNGSNSPNPLDLPVHLNLDLTESVNPIDRRNHSPRDGFPLDLPANASSGGAPPANESMRLPDFLPVQIGGRTQSPTDRHTTTEIERLNMELDAVRTELFSERSRNQRLESELTTAMDIQETLREQIRNNETLHRLREHSSTSTNEEGNSISSGCDLINQLRNQIRQLQDELNASRNEVQTLRSERQSIRSSVNTTTEQAEVKIRELLASFHELRILTSELDNT